MSKTELTGKIQTVNGIIDPDELGITLPHEHLLCDSSFFFEEPTEVTQKALAYESVKMQNLGWLRQNPSKNLDNMKLWDEELAISELNLYKIAGGCSIVEMSNIGLGRDPLALARISRATGVNIIMGTGYYVGLSHPPGLENKSVDTIADEMVKDIINGIGSTGISAGILGEIGCSEPLKRGELKVLNATALAQKKTGVPVNIHPGNSDKSPLEIVELFRDFGGDVSHTVISHVDNRIGNDLEMTLELASTGCYIEYDLFGQAQRPLSHKMKYSLSDWQRVEGIKKLIDHGYLHQLLISHDVFHKIALQHYGGFGYDYILTTVVDLMRLNEIYEEQIHSLLIKNPKKMLQFKKY
jgi:phosphotriesterase-related protein